MHTRPAVPGTKKYPGTRIPFSIQHLDEYFCVPGTGTQQTTKMSKCRNVHSCTSITQSTVSQDS